MHFSSAGNPIHEANEGQQYASNGGQENEEPHKQQQVYH